MRKLSRIDLKRLRESILSRGGVLYEKMCPVPDCHSAVVGNKESVACLTCGWRRPGKDWGKHRMRFYTGCAEKGPASLEK